MRVPLVLRGDLRDDRGCPLAGPRRRDLFSAIRLRQEAVSGREKRRRRRVSSWLVYQTRMVAGEHQDRRGLSKRGHARLNFVYTRQRPRLDRLEMERTACACLCHNT